MSRSSTPRLISFDYLTHIDRSDPPELLFLVCAYLRLKHVYKPGSLRQYNPELKWFILLILTVVTLL